MVDAMTVVAARYGYGGASVARVIKHAGVSRATFYEQFANKDECFLVACNQIAKGVEQEIGREVGDPPREILGALLAGADRDPAAARIVLIEALAGDAAARAEQDRLLAEAEQAVERYLNRPPAGALELEIPARAALGGVASVLTARVLRGETGRLSSLLDDLLVWFDSYAVAAGHRRRTADEWAELGGKIKAAISTEAEVGEGDEHLRSGGGGHREQLVAAVARATREKGYTAMTVADVVAAAHLTRETFYESFRSKQDAYNAAQVFALEGAVSRTAAKFFGEQSWPDRVWSGMEALLRYAAEQPDLVCVDVIESFAAGPAAIRRSFENRMAFSIFLEDGYRQRPEAERLPRLCSEAVGGAIWETLRRHVLAGRGKDVTELIPQAVYLALAPFVGAADALQYVDTRVAAVGREHSA
jgi:AcrR family transcriptional regulator